MEYLLSRIAALLGAKLVGEDRQVSGVVTDSRSLSSGPQALFAAMRGVNHDGHDYCRQMYLKGVRAFMVEKECDLPEDASQVIVTSTLDALQAWAADFRNSYRGTVVAIAGSNAKTTVKEWIGQCGPSDGTIYRSPRSYNSQLGVALSLLRMDPQSRIAIIETGISRPGEMQRLQRMVRPDTVIFTSLGDAHQQNFSCIEQKLDEKLIIAQTAADIIYHSEYRLLARLVESRYANRNLIDASAQRVPQFPDDASRRNAQTVAAFMELMELPQPDFSLIHSLTMRLDLKPGIQDSIVIDDTYSADIDSLSIALDFLVQNSGQRRRMLILSDILQSGMESGELYSLVAQKVRAAGVDTFIGVGEVLSAVQEDFAPNTYRFLSTEQLLSSFGEIDFSGAAILIKGNRASQTERISRHLELKSHTTVLEVNLQAMARNISYFREHMHKGVKLTAMVKASSYGAGDADVARLLESQGVDYLAVAFADEGVILRQNGITMPVIVLNADEESFPQMVEHSLEPEIYSFRSLEAFREAVLGGGYQNYPVHIKLDTGMHRLGFSEQEIPQLIGRLKQISSQIRIASVFTHMCTQDMPEEDEFTRLQISRFESMSSEIVSAFDYKILRHCAASAAILRFPEAQFDMCRLGLGLYGFGYEHNDALEMVSKLRTRIVQIHELQPGETVGYGRHGKIETPSRIATIPVGYADGLNRKLSRGAWNMLVHGKPAPVIGNICMDSCMIDITGIDGVEEGDDVIVFSQTQGNTPEDMAALLGTIPYEVLTSVSKRVKRIYTND